MPADGTLLGSGTYGKVHYRTYGEYTFVEKRLDREDHTWIVEYILLSQLRWSCHANICHLTGMRMTLDHVFLQFPFVSQTLLEWSQTAYAEEYRDERSSWRTRWSISKALRILHRDIKPNNILVCRTSSSMLGARLCDFGLATLSVGQKLSYEAISLWYRPPELLHRSHQYSFEVDLWSLGVVHLELLRRECPFAGKSREEVLKRMASFSQQSPLPSRSR